MTRPTEFSDLTTTSVTIDRSQLSEAKARGVNISNVLRVALTRKLKVRAAAVEVQEAETKLRGVPKVLKNHALAKIAVDPRRAATWASVINTRCNTSVNAQDLVALVPRC